jgi:hypothetical protein
MCFTTFACVNSVNQQNLVSTNEPPMLPILSKRPHEHVQFNFIDLGVGRICPATHFRYVLVSPKRYTGCKIKEGDKAACNCGHLE